MQEVSKLSIISMFRIENNYKSMTSAKTNVTSFDSRSHDHFTSPLLPTVISHLKFVMVVSPYY